MNSIRIQSKVAKHSFEYLASKIETAISMLKRSIVEDVSFDYLLGQLVHLH